MADLLTHVLVAYILATLLWFRYRWITPQFVTIAMIGAIIPDLSRLALLVPEHTIEALLGGPFSWFAVHTLGGVLLLAVGGGLLTTSTYRRRVIALILVGAFSHLLLDGLLIKPDGYAAPMLMPFTTVAPPTPGVYLSTDRLPVAIAATVGAAVWVLRYRVAKEGETTDRPKTP